MVYVLNWLRRLIIVINFFFLVEVVSPISSCLSIEDFSFTIILEGSHVICSKICSELTIKIPERLHWRRSDVFIVYFEHISHLVLMFLLLTLNM